MSLSLVQNIGIFSMDSHSISSKIHHNNRRNSPIQAIFPTKSVLLLSSLLLRLAALLLRHAGRFTARRLERGETCFGGFLVVGFEPSKLLDYNQKHCDFIWMTKTRFVGAKTGIEAVRMVKIWEKLWWICCSKRKGNLHNETMYFKNPKNLGSPSTQWRSNHANSSKLRLEPLNKLLFWSILISLQIETLDIVTECGLLILLVY